MTKMVNKLLLQGITVERAAGEFTHEGHVYGAGSYVVSLAQPKRGVIRWLLGRTYYPDKQLHPHRVRRPDPPVRHVGRCDRGVHGGEGRPRGHGGRGSPDGGIPSG